MNKIIPLLTFAFVFIPFSYTAERDETPLVRIEDQNIREFTQMQSHLSYNNDSMFSESINTGASLSSEQWLSLLPSMDITANRYTLSLPTPVSLDFTQLIPTPWSYYPPPDPDPLLVAILRIEQLNLCEMVRIDFDSIFRPLNRELRELLDFLRNFRLYDLNPGEPGFTQPSGQPDVTGQEALSLQSAEIRRLFMDLAGRPHNAELLIKNIPDPRNRDAAFKEVLTDIAGLYDCYLSLKRLPDRARFRLANARAALVLLDGNNPCGLDGYTLSLLDGKAEVRPHSVSRLESYADLSYPDMPDCRQLFVLLARLCMVDKEKFVREYLMENTLNPKLRDQFLKNLRSGRFDVVTHFDDPGLILAADEAAGNPLVKALKSVLEESDTLPAPGWGRQGLRLLRHYHAAQYENLVSMTEALFMIMRGHNERLTDTREPYRAACADGAYLNLLRGVTERLPESDYGFHSIVLDCFKLELNNS